MDARQTATNSGLRRAFEARNRLSVSRSDPVNVFDVCQELGIEVRFVDAKSLEGMYCRAPRLSIFLPSSHHRPRGRQGFSCAHELGHHELGHGTRVDKYVAGSPQRHPRQPEEIAANVFAAHFLMPRQAVVTAVRLRNWEITQLTPRQTFTLAGLFGVGYQTLLWQLSSGLQLLPDGRRRELLRSKPKSIRGELWPASAETRLVIWDALCGGLPVDLEVGDFLMICDDASADSELLQHVGSISGCQIQVARTVGQSRITHARGKALIRVARQGYIGTWRHRFLTEEQH